MKVIQLSAKAQHGKDASATIIKEMLEAKKYKVLIAHYADLVKFIATTYFNWDGKKDEKGRSLLQRIGTEDVRTVYPDYWVDFVKSVLSIYKNEWDYVLIPDCRFPNEANAFNSNDNIENIVIRITRLNFENSLTPEQRLHASETSLDDYLFDYYIESNSGLDALRTSLETFVEDLLKENTIEQ